jgi:hypothetical protein
MQMLLLAWIDLIAVLASAALVGLFLVRIVVLVWQRANTLRNHERMQRLLPFLARYRGRAVALVSALVLLGLCITCGYTLLNVRFEPFFPRVVKPS